MKVNSNLWQNVSSFHERSVAIPLEFPSRMTWSTPWSYKPGKSPRTIYFTHGWAASNPRAQGAKC